MPKIRKILQILQFHCEVWFLNVRSKQNQVLSYEKINLSIGKVGSNFGNFALPIGLLYVISADGSAKAAAILAMGLPPPRLP